QKRRYKQKPPAPFDLTTLQTEAYRHHKIPPSDTLKIAQELYTNALISYPRTSSQQIPQEINLKEILERLHIQAYYRDIVEELLAKDKLTPANGKKTDPAHPAIHPTGECPNHLEGRKAKIYDLIIRRFFATLGDPAVRQSIKIQLDNNGEGFKADGTSTVEPGWHRHYGSYAKFDEKLLPDLEKNQQVEVKEVLIHEKQTQPPKRYTPASIVRELEKRNLGTKATRSQIVDILFKRGYLDGKSIEVTPLGMKVVETLKKYCPAVLEDKLTHGFEERMEQIQENKLTQNEVVEQAEKTITEISEDFKRKEDKIGQALAGTLIQTQRHINSLGDCPSCGKTLVKRMSRQGKRFIGCTGYPNCTYTTPLPQRGKLEKAGECKQCRLPMMKLIRKGRRPWIFCINPDCPSKKNR
ncbi:MAG: DNA topoisomerase I, partial [Candidatus Altiarchaeales archaeon]|nr:DNA topoisomerase I [Candidatus Altiarchaeales archaeon]